MIVNDSGLIVCPGGSLQVFLGQLKFEGRHRETVAQRCYLVYSTAAVANACLLRLLPPLRRYLA